jgi:hypothetical protein
MNSDQPTNPHRGSDFNEFLIEQGLMPTPRTDAIAHRGLGSVAYIAEVTGLARQLERELAAERALADRLRKSAQALVDRWDSVSWKDVPHTGKFIRSLDDALAAWKDQRQ